MGSTAMAVRLILVALVLVSLSLAAAQQSEGTGGRTVDRRLNIRRFSARRKAEGAQRRKRPGATEEELARRKLLFERNRINRKRPAAASATERASTSRPVTERRIQSSRTFRPRSRPDNFVRPNNEVDPPVVRISNNDREIQDLVLKGRQEEEDRERTPFQGTSAVGTVSQPSGSRSSNEQIVRVSFKKPATAEKADKQDALEALLRTVNKKVEASSNSNFVDSTGLSVQQKAAVREMEQDDREAEALEARKKLREEENEVEGGRQRFRSFPSRSGSRANLPRRRTQGGESSAARRDRVRTRGRGQTRLRTTAAPVTATEAAFVQAEDLTLPPGLSFPTAPTAAPLPAQEAPRSACKSPSSHSSTCSKSSTSSSCARSKVPPEDRACPADLPAASSPCSTSFQTLADLPAWPATTACPTTVLPAVPAPTSSSCSAAELPTSAAAARSIPKPCAAEAAAEHPGSANTADIPASTSSAAADFPASAEIPAPSSCPSTAHSSSGLRLCRKPLQSDQLQQQLCPV